MFNVNELDVYVETQNKIQKMSGDVFGGIEDVEYKSFGEFERRLSGTELVLELRWFRESQFQQLGW